MKKGRLNRFRMGAVVFLVVLIFFPFVEKQIQLFPPLELYGVERAPQMSSLTFKTWFDGRYSTAAEKSLTHNIGFRGLSVKLVHQLKFFLFKDVQGNSRTRLTLGKNDWIYETAYIEEAVDPDVIPEKERNSFVADLKKLQQELERRNILFVLAISPSKVSIIPDYLPEDIKQQIHTAKKGNYELLIPELRANKVRVADGNALFKRLRTSVEFLFSPGGTHWSYNGSFYFSRYLLEMLEPELPGRMILPELAGTRFMLPQESDKDIGNLLNLFSCRALKIKLPYPQIHVDALPMAQRPDMLFIGDSFGHQIMNWMNQFKAANKVDFLYYYRRHFDYPPQDIPGYYLKQIVYYGKAITFETMDWERLLLSKDVVVLEINEVGLKDKGWGFAQDAVKFLTTSGIATVHPADDNSTTQ